MLKHYIKAINKLVSVAGLLAFFLVANQASAAMFEYKARLFGEGMQVHNCINLDSRGSIFGDYDETAGTLSNIQGELKFVTITDGFIESGLNKVENYVLGTFNDNAPEYFRNKNIFVDLSRGASYETTIVNDRKVREWGWALFFDPEDYSNSNDLVADLFRDKDSLKTVFDPEKTFAELCPEYANGNSAGSFGSCSAGVEFFTNKGTAAAVPVPAAFYLLATGVIGLASFSRKRHTS